MNTVSMKDWPGLHAGNADGFIVQVACGTTRDGTVFEARELHNIPDSDRWVARDLTDSSTTTGISASWDTFMANWGKIYVVIVKELIDDEPDIFAEIDDTLIVGAKIIADAQQVALWRKDRPMHTGCLLYFPDALMEVANVSRVANEQHNPGQPVHWAKEKSQDELDALMRHLAKAGGFDTDGLRESAKIAWRALANLQRELDHDIEAGVYPEYVV